MRGINVMRMFSRKAEVVAYNSYNGEQTLDWICPKCGFGVVEEYNFCPYCGQKIIFEKPNELKMLKIRMKLSNEIWKRDRQ